MAAPSSTPPIAPTHEPHAAIGGETKTCPPPPPQHPTRQETFNMDLNCDRCTNKLPNSRFDYIRMTCCGVAYHYKCLQQFHPPNNTEEEHIRHREYFRTHQEACPGCGATLLEGSNKEKTILKNWCAKGKAWAWSIRGQRFKELFKAKINGAKNASLAYKCYMKAAKLGDSVGMHNVGYISASRKQYIDARYWWTKAARLGDKGSIECLKLLKKRADQDPFIMVELNSCSVDTTVPHSGQWLFEEGTEYWHGMHFKKQDEKRSRLMIEASASSGFPMAVADCHLMGWNGMDKDQKKAFDMCLQIERDTNGYHWAQCLLADCYYFGNGTDQDYTKAFERYTKSSEQENSNAMNNVGNCYEKGQGCDQNLTKALELYEKSANLGHSTAMYNLGNCYKNGRGVTKDVNQAREWYTKAVALGDGDAQTVLALLESEVEAAELGNEDASASLSGLDEIEHATMQANDGGVVGETKSNGGVVDD
jgi:TPR repeat protein